MSRANLSILSAVVLVITACAAPAAPPTPTPTKAVPAPAATPTRLPATPTPAPPKPTLTPAKLEKVKIGDTGFMGDVPLYIAQEKGYLQEQGMEADFQRFRTAADMVAPLSTGELHVGGGTLSAGLFSAVGRGVEIKAFATRSRPLPGYAENWWMVRTDLKDQIKTFADLKGRTINMLSPGGITWYALGETFKKYGLTLKDINMVHLTPPDTGAAFKGKSIDISLVVEPNVVLFEEQGLAIKWKMMFAEIEPVDVAVVMFSERWAKENPELAKKFAVAYLKGHRDYVRAFKKGPNRGEVINIAIRYTAVKDAALYEKMYWTIQPENAYIDKASVKRQQDWFFENGQLERKADIDKLVDNSYLDNAHKVLGEFKM